MEQNTITINQLIAQMLDEMKRIGYSDTTIHRKVAFARAFGRYQRATGREAYVISELFAAGKIYLSLISSVTMR